MKTKHYEFDVFIDDEFFASYHLPLKPEQKGSTYTIREDDAMIEIRVKRIPQPE